MELINWDGLSLGSIVAGLIPTPIIFFGGIITTWASNNRLAGRFLFALRNSFFLRTVVLMGSAVALGLLVDRFAVKFLGFPLSGLIAGLIYLSCSQFLIQFRFAKIGLHGAELSVQGGTDYRASLNLCTNYFAFLGTGASKLTGAKNFEDAMLRCSSGSHTSRLLLSHPDNQIIRDAEISAGVAPGTYRFSLIKSLKRLRELREDRNARISVRFYRGTSTKDFENFRMLFVDDHSLLLSYNVYGRGNGSKTPQVVVRKSLLSGETEGFYHAFRSYYEGLWDSSQEWNFEEFT